MAVSSWACPQKIQPFERTGRVSMDKPTVRSSAPTDGAEPEFDPRDLRNALGCFATGVTIITADGPGDVQVGLTANSFSSVSLNPALVSWSLASHAPSMPIFQDCSHYAIHVLSRQQQELAIRFSQPRDDKFDGLKIQPGLGNAPIIPGALATFQCHNAYRHAGGDHVIFLGAVEKYDHTDGEPLVFHQGQFTDVAPNK